MRLMHWDYWTYLRQPTRIIRRIVEIRTEEHKNEQARAAAQRQAQQSQAVRRRR